MGGVNGFSRVSWSVEVVLMGRLLVIGSSVRGLCRIFVVPLQQSPLGAHRVGFREVSQSSSIVSTWPSSYSIVVVLWSRSFSKDIGISRCPRGSNNAFLYLRWTRTRCPFSSLQWSLSVRWIGPMYTVFGLLELMWYTTPMCVVTSFSLMIFDASDSREVILGTSSTQF